MLLSPLKILQLRVFPFISQNHFISPAKILSVEFRSDFYRSYLPTAVNMKLETVITCYQP